MKKYFRFKYAKDRVLLLIVYVAVLALIIAACVSEPEKYPASRLIVVGILWTPVMIWMVYGLLHLDRCLKNVEAYCEKSGYTMEDLENDFASADVLGHRIRCGKRWIYYLNQLGKPDVVGIEQIVSVDYTYSSSSKSVMGSIICNLDNKEEVLIPSYKNHYRALAKILESHGITAIQ